MDKYIKNLIIFHVFQLVCLIFLKFWIFLIDFYSKIMFTLAEWTATTLLAKLPLATRECGLLDQKSFFRAHESEKAGKKLGNQFFRNASVPPQMRPLCNERLKLQKWFLPKSRMRSQKVTTAEITCRTGSANSKGLHLAKSRFFFTKRSAFIQSKAGFTQRTDRIS